MIKEAKNIDFYTTGRQPSDEEFVRISEWIKNNKLKKSLTPKLTEQTSKQKTSLSNKKLKNSRDQVCK